MGDNQSDAKESSLSKQQTEIVRSREAFYQATTQPELVDFFRETKEIELNKNFLAPSATELAMSNAGAINDAFDAQGDQLSKSLAQRGLEGSGVEGASLAMMGSAKAQALAGNVNQSKLQAMLQSNNVIGQQNQVITQQQNVRQSGINSLLSQAPQSTQSTNAGYIPQNDDTPFWQKAALGAVSGASSAAASSMMT